MCNHIYTTKSKIRKYKGQDVPCIFNSIADNIHYFADGLPHDSSKKCIFHSIDLAWKSEQQFSKILLETIDKLNKDDSVKEIDLDEIIIADANVDVLTFKFKITKDFKMNKAKVYNPFTFQSTVFGRQFDCKQTIFLSSAKIRDTKFNSCEFSKCTFKKDVMMRSCDFSGAYTSFEESVFEESINVMDSKFKGMAFFSGAKFLENGWLSAVSFQRVVFEYVCNFDRCFSECSFVFHDVVFQGNTDFKEPVFTKVKKHSNHSTKPYSFKKITIDKGAVLSFIGTEHENDIFQDQVEFEFADEIKGRVIFDNMNFRFIAKKSRDEILRLEKLGKIEIGDGCIKYRHQTKLKHLDIGTDGQQIILEIARTFTNYFISHNGVNLGIEVVEKTSDTLVFFYYSDEDITTEEFHEMLQITQEYLWSTLLLNPTDIGKDLVTKNPANMKKYLDGLYSLMSIFQKIGFRMALNEWSEYETKHLTAALELGGRIPFSNGDLHMLISRSPMVDNVRNFLGTYSYKQLYAENKPMSSNNEKVFNVIELKRLVFENDTEVCLDMLGGISKNVPEIKSEMGLLNSRYQAIEEKRSTEEYTTDDYNREMSMFSHSLLRFIDNFDEKFNVKIEKEGIAVLPASALESREIGLDAPNIVHLAYDKIIYISSSEEKNYLDIHTTNGDTYKKLISLVQLENQLPDAFLRIEGSHILNMKFWKGATSNFTFAFFHQTTTEDEKKIPIGRQYVSTLKQYLKNRY